MTARWLLRASVPLLLLGLVWHLADGPQAVRRIATADPRWLALAFAALHAQTVLSALRWRQVAAACGQPLPAGRAIREYYVGQLINQTVPGGIVGDAARAARSAAVATGLGGAATAVALERAVGQAALLALLGAGMASSLAFGELDWPRGAGTVLFICAAAAALIAGLAWRADPVRRAVHVAVTGRQVWPAQAGLAVAIVALNLTAFAAVARATGTDLTPEATVTLVPLILLAMVIPLSVAGWGWREGAAAALFPLAGATAGAGLAASAAYGALMLAAAMPGVIWLVHPPRQPPA